MAFVNKNIVYVVNSTKRVKNMIFEFQKFIDLLKYLSVSKQFANLINSYYNSIFNKIFGSDVIPDKLTVRRALIIFEKNNPNKIYDLIHWSIG